MDVPWRLLGSEGAAGLACAVKAAGFLAIAGLASVGLRKRAAATRHMVWCLGLAGALVMFPWAFALPRWGVPVLSARPEPAPARPGPTSEPILTSAPVIAPRIEIEARLESNDLITTSSPPPRARPIVWWPVAWGVGTAAVLAWTVVGRVAVWRLGRSSEKINDPAWDDAAREASNRLGVTTAWTLLRGGESVMPLTWGLFRPVVLLPAEADAWPLERRRAVLLHELAHVKRRDSLTQLLGQLTCAVYWFNPMAWWASARLRAERELACDDLVLEAGERPSDYAAELLGVARSLRSPREMSPAMAMARPSGLESRLLAILDPRRQRRGPGRWLVASCLVGVLGTSIVLGAVRLVARELAGKEISGLVVGADGKPIVGADVVALNSRPAPRGLWDFPYQARLLGKGKTDAEGRYRIEGVDDSVMPEDQLLLIATAPGLGFLARNLPDLDGSVEDPIQLLAEQKLEVRLVDLEGSPLSGAEVRLIYAYPGSGGVGLTRESLTNEILPELAQSWTTDPEGRFTLRGIGPGCSASLEVRAEGFGSQRLPIEIKANVDSATLAMRRAHVVKGRVTLGKGGPPAVGARVKARSMSEKQGIGQYMGDANALTDQDGRYRVEASAGGSVRIEVSPPLEGGEAYLLRGDLVVPGDSVSSVADLVLPRGVLVRGKITEAGSGLPIAGAVVHHQAQERNNPYFIKGNSAWFNGDEQKAITAPDGTFQLAVMPGPGYLLVKGPTNDYLHDEISLVELHGGLIWPNTRQYPDALKKLEPKPDDGPIDLELTLRKGTTLSGRVVDHEGRPAREAVLFSRWYLTPSDMTINYSQRRLPTRGGRFALRGCDPDATAPVFFLDADRQLGAVVELSGKQAGQELEVTLEPCGSASLRLVDDQGKPLRPGRRAAHLEIVLTPGASFGEALPGLDKESPLMADSIHVANLDRERYRNMVTDEEGRFNFPTLIPGAPYRISVYNQPVKTQVEFTVKPGEAKDLGDLTIRNVDQAG